MVEKETENTGRFIFSDYQIGKLEKEMPGILDDIAEISAEVNPDKTEKMKLVKLDEDALSNSLLRDIFEKHMYEYLVSVDERKEGKDINIYATEEGYNKISNELRDLLLNSPEKGNIIIATLEIKNIDEVKPPSSKSSLKFAESFYNNFKEKIENKLEKGELDKDEIAKKLGKDKDKIKMGDVINYWGWGIRNKKNEDGKLTAILFDMPSEDITEKLSPEEKADIFLSNYNKKILEFDDGEYAVLNLDEKTYNQLKESLGSIKDKKEKQYLESLLDEKEVEVNNQPTTEYYLKFYKLDGNTSGGEEGINIKDVRNVLASLAKEEKLDDALVSKSKVLAYHINKSMPYAKDIKDILSGSGISVDKKNNKFKVKETDDEFIVSNISYKEINDAVNKIVSEIFPEEKEKEISLTEFKIYDKEAYMKKQKKGRLPGLLTEIAGWVGIGALFASYLMPAVVPPVTHSTTHVPNLEQAVDGHNITVGNYTLEVPDQMVQLTLPNGTVDVPAFDMLNGGYNLVVPQHNISIKDTNNISGLINESKVSVYTYPSGAQITENSTSNSTFNATLPTLVLNGDSYVLHVPDTNSTVGGFTAVYTPNKDAQGRILSYNINVDEHTMKVDPYSIHSPAHDETSETYIQKDWFGIGGVVSAVATALFHGKRRAKNEINNKELENRYNAAIAKIRSLPKY